MAGRLRAGALSSTALALLALASLLVMNELDRLVGDVIAPSGRVHALSGVYGPTAFLETDAWADWAASAFPVGALVRAHLVADLVLIACYATLLVRLVRRLAPVGSPARRLGVRLIGALVIADLLEDALLLALSFPGAPGWLVWPQVVATLAKTAAAIVLLGFLLLGRVVGERMRRALGRAWRGLYAQRLVAIVVGAIAVVSLVTADGVLEQLPDVYRSWVGYGGLDVLPLAMTLLAFALTGTGLLFLTRGRVRRYVRSRVDDRPETPLVPWVVAAGAAAVVGVALGIAQNRSPADWVPLIVFVAALLAVAGLSWLIRGMRARGGARPAPPLRPPDTHDDAAAARHAGDVLIIGWVALAGLGPFKAFIAPIVLGATGGFDDSRFAGTTGWTIALAAAFLVLAVGGAVAFRRWAASDPPTATAASASTAIGATLEAAVQSSEVHGARHSTSGDAQPRARHPSPLVE